MVIDAKCLYLLLWHWTSIRAKDIYKAQGLVAVGMAMTIRGAGDKQPHVTEPGLMVTDGSSYDTWTAHVGAALPFRPCRPLR